MIRLMLTAVALAVSGAAAAKLPPLDDAAKAKAAEAAAKAAWQGKVAAFQLCKVQDRIAAAYRGKSAASRPAVAVPAGTTTAVATAPSAGAAAAPAAKPPTPTATTASQGGGTPVATVGVPAAPVPACADPGPFAYAPPEQKPLETSGAHSPAPNASSPPSVRSNSAEMAPAKPATANSKKP